MVEHSTADRPVPGSNPGVPSFLLILNYFVIVNYITTFINYLYYKIDTYFFFFIDWLRLQQTNTNTTHTKHVTHFVSQR